MTELAKKYLDNMDNAIGTLLIEPDGIYSGREGHERFASIDMGISNKKYEEDWHRISGKLSDASKANDRYWKLYKLAEQIKSVLSLM